MQAEVDGLQLENKRKDSSLETFRMEQERLNNKLKMQEGTNTMFQGQVDQVTLSMNIVLCAIEEAQISG